MARIRAGRRQSLKWILNVGRKDAVSQMAHLICEVTCRSTGSATPGGTDFGFPVTQMDLGDMLGLAPAQINRTVKRLLSMAVGTLSGRHRRGISAVADLSTSLAGLESDRR